MTNPASRSKDRVPERSKVRTVGRYALYGEIASGGMATVYFGRLTGPVGFSRTVAVKQLHAQFARDPEFVSMFLDEARLAARIRHPNVVPMLDVVATRGELYLVMEYIQGETLSRLGRICSNKGMRIPVPVLASIVVGSLHGLHAAHEAHDEHGAPLNIVHRDISPQNILVGQDGVPRILDFGVAKASGRLQATQDGKLKGKIAFMAPEQLLGHELSRQTDLFAAGIVLWNGLTGRRLFHGETEAEILVKILQDAAEPPSTYVPEVAHFDAVCAKALAKNAQERFGTAREMADAIEACTELASPAEVSDWFLSVADDLIHERASRIAEIEASDSGFDISTTKHLMDAISDPSNSSSLPPPKRANDDDIDTQPPPVPPNRRRAIMVIGAVALLGGVATASVMITKKPAAPLMPPTATVAPTPSVAIPAPPIERVSKDISPSPSAVLAATPSAEPKSVTKSGRTPGHSTARASASTIATGAASVAKKPEDVMGGRD